MTEEQMKQLSEADLEAIAAGDMSRVSDEGLALLSGEGQGFLASLNQGADELLQEHPVLKAIAEYNMAKDAGLVRGLSMGNLEPEDLPVVGKAVKLADENSPGGKMLGELEGSVGSGMALGSGISAGVARIAPSIAKYLAGSGGGSALARILLNSGTGATQGALRKPKEGETRAGNAADDALLGASLGTTAEGLAGLATPVMGGVGGWLGGLNSLERQAYMANPKEAQRLASSLRDNPDQLNRELQTLLRGSRVAGGREGGAISEMIDATVAPARAEKMRNGIQKYLEIDPTQLQGTAAESELQRIMAAQAGFPKTIRTGSTQTPMNTGVEFPTARIQSGLPFEEVSVTPGKDMRVGIDQHNWDAEQLGLPLRSVRTSEKPASYAVKPMEDLATIHPDAEFAQQLDLPLAGADQVSRTNPNYAESFGPVPFEAQYGLPLKTKSALTTTKGPKTPKKVTVSYAQADRLRRKASDAAYEKRAKLPNPTAYDPASDLDHQAAMRLRSGMDAVGPKNVALDDQIEEAMNYSARAKELGGNLASLLNPSRGTGSASNRALGSYLHRHGGPNFTEMADQTSAATKLDGDLTAGALSL